MVRRSTRSAKREASPEIIEIISPKIPRRTELVRSDVGTSYAAWTWSAHFDQSDNRFSSSAGQQCMTIACAALCFLKLKCRF